MGHLLLATRHLPLATKSKSGQGLPLNMIVIAIIVILVLVLVVVFATGGIGKLFRQTNIIGETSDISMVQTACRVSCNKLATADTVSEFKSSEYCTRKFNIDRNSDGKVTDTSSGIEVGLKCWHLETGKTDVPAISCSMQLRNGTVLIAGSSITGSDAGQGNC